MKKEGTPQDVVDDTIELADRLGANRILFLGDYDMMHLLVEGRNCVPEDWEIGLIYNLVNSNNDQIRGPLFEAKRVGARYPWKTVRGWFGRDDGTAGRRDSMWPAYNEVRDER